MANELDSTRKIYKTKTKKLTSIIDFSALVSLSFLLIMFYMLTSAMSKPQTIGLSLPEDNGCIEQHIICGVDPNRVLTILLDSNNNIIYYQGVLNSLISEPKSINYGKLGIRKVLLIRKLQIEEYDATRGKKSYDNMIVIIKPSKKSNYKNLVDILDEMAIVGIETYSIVNNFTSDEVNLLKNK